MTLLSDRQTEADVIWAIREKKTWVVRIGWNGGRDTKIVSARTLAGAIETAKRFSNCPSRAYVTARLAHPVYDLGMRRVEPTE